MPVSFRRLSAIALIVAGALAACGSSSGGSPSPTVGRPPSGSDANQIGALIEDLFTTTDTSVCQTDFTDLGVATFQSTSTGETCPMRIEKVAQARPDGAIVRRINVRGSVAVATATAGNEALRFGLVNQAGSWRINSVVTLKP